MIRVGALRALADALEAELARTLAGQRPNGPGTLRLNARRGSSGRGPTGGNFERGYTDKEGNRWVHVAHVGWKMVPRRPYLGPHLGIRERRWWSRLLWWRR